jgi:UDP-N-acetylglucosamine 2-epimerase (non-hydrolysing)
VSRKKVMTLVGTRPELIKMSQVIKKLDQYFDHVFVHTGQNFDFELGEIFYQDLGLRQPDHFLNAAKPTAAGTIASVIEKVDALLESERPDAFVIYGDTNSCLSVIPAKRRQIPIFHLEAGNRCFDQRVPEEINRKVVDHLSDINFVHSEHARRYLLSEGLRPETVFKTGSPMNEVIAGLKTKLDSSDVLKRLKLNSKSYFIVSAHREENVDSPANFADLLQSLNHLAETYPNYPVKVSTHPRTRKKLESLGHVAHTQVEFLKPLGLVDYLKLQEQSFCVLSDSGTLTEEASLLGFPGVMIRQAHERPEGMDRGVTVMSGLKPEDVLRAVKMVTDSSTHGPLPVADYDNTQFSEQVVRIIESYIPYVNQRVWFKS